MSLEGNDFNNFLAEGIENVRDQGISSHVCRRLGVLTKYGNARSNRIKSSGSIGGIQQLDASQFSSSAWRSSFHLRICHEPSQCIWVVVQPSPSSCQVQQRRSLRCYSNDKFLSQMRCFHNFTHEGRPIIVLAIPSIRNEAISRASVGQIICEVPRDAPINPEKYFVEESLVS